MPRATITPFPGKFVPHPTIAGNQTGGDLPKRPSGRIIPITARARADDTTTEATRAPISSPQEHLNRVEIWRDHIRGLGLALFLILCGTVIPTGLPILTAG